MPTLDDPIRLAREIGDQICATAEPVDGGCRWLSRHDENDQGDYRTGVYMGATGIALFLLNLFERTGEARYRDTALGALRWLESQVVAAGEGQAGPGLYEGRGGLAYVYGRGGAVTGEAALRQRAEEHARVAMAMPASMTEILFGTAGVGLMLLEMHRTTAAGDYLQEAAKAGDTLLRLAEPAGEGCRWHVWSQPPEGRQNRCCTGMAHGAAGIGYFLVDLFRATNEPRFAEGARAAARRLLELAEREGPVWAWDRLDPPSDRERLVQWCHGAPGNGLFFLRAFTVLGDPELREAAERCAEATLAAGDIRENPSQCHGLCGNAELFLELYRALDDPRYVEMARQFAEMALKYRRETGNGIEWQSHFPGITTPDYLVGSAGVGQFFLRFADPKNTSMPLH